MCTVSECMCTVSECMCTVANISAMYEYAHAHCCVVRADGWNQGCQCPSPYSGETCEVVDICANVDCGHGTCSPDGDGKTWIECNRSSNAFSISPLSRLALVHAS